MSLMKEGTSGKIIMQIHYVKWIELGISLCFELDDVYSWMP